MFFLMIVGIIFTAIAISRVVDPYTPEALYRAFEGVCAVAAVFVILGLIGLERPSAAAAATPERHSWGALIGAALGSPQARLFFVYMIALLIGVHGQDVVLEPFAAEAYGLAPDQTTRITSIWGTCVLLTIAVAGFLQSRLSKIGVARWGAWGAFIGLMLIAASPLLGGKSIFYTGVVLLGLGTGLATVSNLSLMLDMTIGARVGLFIGAWGVADSFARLGGALLGGALRDVITQATANPVAGYVAVFAVLSALMGTSLILLGRIDVQSFQRGVATPSVIETAALVGEVHSG
jgi:BCD family chlorophyll transporter-like MFS transporter